MSDQKLKVKFIKDKIKRSCDEFFEEYFNDYYGQCVKRRIKTHLDKKIKEMISDFKKRQIPKFMKVGNKFFETQISPEMVEFIESELKRNIELIIKDKNNEIIKGSESSIEFKANEFVEEQINKLKKISLLEDIEYRVKQYSDKLIEDKMKQSMTEFINKHIEDSLKYEEDLF